MPELPDWKHGLASRSCWLLSVRSLWNSLQKIGLADSQQTWLLDQSKSSIWDLNQSEVKIDESWPLLQEDPRMLKLNLWKPATIPIWSCFVIWRWQTQTLFQGLSSFTRLDLACYLSMSDDFNFRNQLLLVDYLILFYFILKYTRIYILLCAELYDLSSMF